MKNKKSIYIGVAVIIIAVAIIMCVTSKNPELTVTKDANTQSNNLHVSLPEVAEAQGVEYIISFDDVTTGRQNESGEDVHKVVHQKTKDGQSFDYFVLYSSTVTEGFLQTGMPVFLGNNVNVTAMNVIEGERKDDGYDVEVVMNDRTLLIAIGENGFIDPTNVRIK